MFWIQNILFFVVCHHISCSLCYRLELGKPKQSAYHHFTDALTPNISMFPHLLFQYIQNLHFSNTNQPHDSVIISIGKSRMFYQERYWGTCPFLLANSCETLRDQHHNGLFYFNSFLLPLAGCFSTLKEENIFISMLSTQSGYTYTKQNSIVKNIIIRTKYWPLKSLKVLVGFNMWTHMYVHNRASLDITSQSARML